MEPDLQALRDVSHSRLAHERLGPAVFAAYGWEAGIGDGAVLARLLALNLGREGVREGSVRVRIRRR